MSGRFFLDTNAIIALLQGDPSLLKKLENPVWLGVSVISVLEFLSFPNLSTQDEQLFMTFLSRVVVVDLQYDNVRLINKIIEMRSKKKMKLPDAIIASSAAFYQAQLISADKRLLKKIIIFDML